MRLSYRDFDLFQRTLLELYEYRDLETFRRAVPGLFLRLIPADHFCLVSYDINPATGATKMIDCLESEPRVTRSVVPQWEQRVWEHPFTRYFLAGGEMTALMFSDFYTLTQLRNSSFWELICKVMEYAHNISLPVESSRGTTAASLGRRGKDFTERDRLILNLLRPHFNRAQKNAELATTRRASAGRALIDYGLLPREREVAGWVGQGKTNPEIAMILQVSPRTIEKHMERILAKLEVENRTAAAVVISGSASVARESFNTAPLP